MRYWLHGILTLLATLIAIVGFFFSLFFLPDKSLPPVPDWVMETAFVIGALTALFGPTLLMTLVPVRCPKCGGRARLRCYSWLFSFRGSGFSMGPRYAYGCDSCPWSTYYWSPYAEQWRHQRASRGDHRRAANKTERL